MTIIAAIHCIKKRGNTLDLEALCSKWHEEDIGEGEGKKEIKVNSSL